MGSVSLSTSMSLDLTQQEVSTLWRENNQRAAPVTSIDRLETFYTIPSQLGHGYCRVMELQPGLWLRIVDGTFYDLNQRISENEHPVQFVACLSGTFDSGEFVLINPAQGYVGGSGIQPSHVVFTSRSQRLIGIDIRMTPHLLQQFFAMPAGDLPTALQPLIQANDWQQRFLPKTTRGIRSVVQQMVDCPFTGVIKRMYLQGKAFELMALQLESILDLSTTPKNATLKPDTAARIHQAAAILRSRLENPPSQTDLAQHVGVCNRTLQRGFKQIFNTTSVGYLTQHRLQKAEQLLREGNCTVAEVANQVGYAHLGHFAAAFRQQFGILPSQCLAGRCSNQGSQPG